MAKVAHLVTSLALFAQEPMRINVLLVEMDIIGIIMSPVQPHVIILFIHLWMGIISKSVQILVIMMIPLELIKISIYIKIKLAADFAIHL